jgi:hypothetical protein
VVRKPRSLPGSPLVGSPELNHGEDASSPILTRPSRSVWSAPPTGKRTESPTHRDPDVVVPGIASPLAGEAADLSSQVRRYVRRRELHENGCPLWKSALGDVSDARCVRRES